MVAKLIRPIDPDLHPIATGNYRIGTPAIQEFYEPCITAPLGR